MRILLIEPDKLLAASYAAGLQAAGHKVRLSHSAQTAISQLDQQPAEVIILEIQMANHNGVEFLYELRSYPEWQNIPVIVHSFVPLAQLPFRSRLADLGITDYLYKPTASLQQLVNSVSRQQLELAPQAAQQPARALA